MEENIFEHLDHSHRVGNNYDWFSLKIDLKNYADPALLERLKEQNSTFDSTEQQTFYLFTHEYLHFLQNVTSAWGTSILADYLLSIIKLGASSVQHETNLTLPIDFDALSNELGGMFKDSTDLLKNVKSRLSNGEGNILFDSPNTYPNYTFEIDANDQLVLKNGRISKRIGVLTIRESMAHIGGMLFNANTDYQIHLHNKSVKHFCSTAELLDKGPEYWILFEYFYQNHYENVALGIYSLCVECLSTLKPEIALKRFFRWLGGNKSSINNLETLVEEWSHSTVEQIDKASSSQKSTQHLQKLIGLCQKHERGHDLFLFCKQILEFILAMNHEFQQGRLLTSYDPIVKSNWYKILLRVGSPIIKYENHQPVLMEGTKSLEVPLSFILGLSKTLDNLQTKKYFTCPFKTLYNICKVTYKSEQCDSTPYTVRNPIADGSECLLVGSLELLGLKDRLQ